MPEAEKMAPAEAEKMRLAQRFVRPGDDVSGDLARRMVRRSPFNGGG
jgi:hypothetical protein